MMKEHRLTIEPTHDNAYMRFSHTYYGRPGSDFEYKTVELKIRRDKDIEIDICISKVNGKSTQTEVGVLRIPNSKIVELQRAINETRSKPTRPSTVDC